MRRASLIFLSSLGVVLVAIAAAIVFLATAGDDFYRWALRQAIEGRLDRRVVVDGTFSFDVGLEPTVIITDVWLENAPWADQPEIARANRIEVQIALRPLLSGIVLVRRLVIDGLTVDLETRPDGQGNWEGKFARREGAQWTAPEDLSLPLFEFVELNDITVTHTNRQSGRETEVALGFLNTTQFAGDGSFAVDAEGALNGRPFQIAGHMGSIEKALDATTPYPVAFTLRSTNLIADLTGTAEDIAAAEGLRMDLVVEAPSISQVLETLSFEAAVSGSARAAVRLQGNLESLAAENIAFEFIEESGQQLLADGQVANLISGEGLDLNINAILGPAAVRMFGDLPPKPRALLGGLIGMELIGRLSGSLQAPNIEDAIALLDHESGAEMSLQGRAELDLSAEAVGVSTAEATALLFTPDLLLLEEALGTPLAGLGAVHATADIAWAGDQISLRSAEVDAAALPRLQLGAAGRIGEFSAKDLAFDLDPQIDISATALDNRALVSLVETLAEQFAATTDPPLKVAEFFEALPEIAPVVAGVRLSRADGAYRFDDLKLSVGKNGVLQVDVAGSLGPLRPERDAALEEIALAMTVAVASIETFAQWIPAETPDLRNLTGRFNVDGTSETLSVSNVMATAEGPDGLTGGITGQIAEISLTPGFAAKGLALDADLRWPDMKGVYNLAGIDLPDLGAVTVRATVRDSGETFALTDIDATAVTSVRPVVRATGAIADLPALNGIELAGAFDLPAATLLDAKDVSLDANLGDVQGRFELSDADGSVGIEVLTAELKNTDLLDLSVKGRFDDLTQLDELRFEASLNVPNVSEVSSAFGFDVDGIGSLAFTGAVSGTDERFQAEGKAQLGGTDLTGSASGSLTGKRPKLQANVQSSLLRLFDFGLAPETDAPQREVTTSQESPPADRPVRRFVFSEEAIPFSALKGFDLDLDVQIDEVEGIRFEIDTAEIKLILEDGLLKVDPLLFNFAGGRIETRLSANAQPDPPEMAIQAVADDVDMGDFLRQVEVEVPIDGQLDMTLDLEASGGSPRALASSLEGGLDLALSDGQVLTGLLDLTVTNPFRWMLSQSARRGYSELNCFVVRFDFKEGVATTVRLLLDTTNVRAEGEGEIDFENEVIDIAVNPRAKRRRLIGISTPFSIEGPLANPTVNVSTAGAATRVVGKTVASPVNLLGSLVPFVNDRGRDSDNACLTLRDDEVYPGDEQ